MYRRLLGSFIRQRIPRETAATCRDCAMWPEGKSIGDGGYYFLRETKCCTFSPQLPNFLVGAILSNRSEGLREGRRRIQERIRTRVGVTPQALLSSARNVLLYEHTRHAFGRSRFLKCPFFDSGQGLCTLHPWSEARCRTWFCKYAAGEDGRQFWGSLCLYVMGVEDVLTDYTSSRLGCVAAVPVFAKNGTQELAPEDLDDRPVPPAVYRSLWGPWAGKEAEFYVKCFRLASGLTPGTLRKFGGIRLDLLRAEVVRRLQMLNATKPPPLLKRRPDLLVTPLADGRYRLTAYADLDPVIITKALFDLLERFDGKTPTGRVCSARRRAGLSVPDKALLLQLYQQRILIDARDSTGRFVPHGRSRKAFDNTCCGR